MRKALIGLPVFALAAAGFVEAAGAMTFISSNWQDTSLSQDVCLDRAERAIKKSDFKALSHTKYSRHGTRGEYTVQLRCAVDKGIVIFMVAGPSNRTAEYLDMLTNNFEGD